MTPTETSRSRGTLIAVVAVVCGLAGFAFTVLIRPIGPSHKLPWIIARATGIGAFVAMTLLIGVGMAFRWPPRTRARATHPELLLRLHSALGPSVVALVVAHVISLLRDPYAGVSLTAVFVPGAATYRPNAVALGAVAAEMLVIVSATAMLAGRVAVRHHWARLHLLAYPTWILTWLHGVLSGSDATTLRLLYAAAAVFVGAMAIPRVMRASRSHQTAVSR